MQLNSYAGPAALLLVVLAAGVFVGLTAAHDNGGDQSHEDCEKLMQEMDNNCQMGDGMMGGMMNGMMGMDDDCSMDDEAGAMQNGGTMGGHGYCPVSE